ALLRSGRGKSQTAASVYYGRATTEHAHFDGLNLELFAHGKKLIPDMGYPEHAAEGDRPGVWTKNTLAHATVVVDARRQDTQAAGRLHHFVSADGFSLVEVDAPETYHSTSEYRRTVALIDIAPGVHYVLDLFRVSGGSQHDYSIHGFDAPFSAEGIALSDPQTEGTLAGPDVPKGTIYDDDGLTDPLRKGRSYYTYRGGGYSYLYNVRRGKPSGIWSANWKDEKSGVGLAATFLSSDEAIVSHGDPPRKPGNPKQLTYVLLRNAGNGITSQFASILEPYRGASQIQSVQQVERTANSLTIKIRHNGGEDIVRHVVGANGSSFSLTRRDAEGNLVKLLQAGGGTLHAAGQNLAIEKNISGRVVSVDPDTSTVEIERDRDSQPFRATGLSGEIARFGNASRYAAYNIQTVEGKGRRLRIGFGTDSFRIGRFVITGVNANGSVLSTKTNLYMASQGYYRGCWLTDEHHTIWLPVDDVMLTPHQPGLRRDGQIRLMEAGAADDRFKPGRIAYLYDFGPGDTFNVTPHAVATRKTDGSFRTRSNGRAAISTT
ncbi:MAG: heparinase II/III family protein, partial [bacterium]|nr:heparinase II/III family protein [bacterium]